MSRTKGSLNKRTRIAMHALKTGELLGNGESPVDLMLRVMRDSEKPLELRLEAAKNVAPYVHPRLNSTEITAKTAQYTDVLDRIAALAHAETQPNEGEQVH